MQQALATSWRLRVYHKLFEVLATPLVMVVLMSYVLFLMVVGATSAFVTRARDEPEAYKWLALAVRIAWLLLGCCYEYPFAIFGGRQHFVWVGSMAVLSLLAHVLTLVGFAFSWAPGFAAELGLVLVVALYLYLMRLNMGILS